MESQKSLMSTLTPKQQKFLEAYLGEANFNATAAARIAGYKSPHPEGSRLLRNATVAEAMNKAWEERGMQPAEIIGRLSDLARASLEDFLEIEQIEPEPEFYDDDEEDDDPKPRRRYSSWRIDLEKAKRSGKLHTLKSLKDTKFGVAIQLHSPLEALDKLARVHKLFADQNVTIDMEFVQIVLAALPDEYRDSVREALLLAGDTGSPAKP